MSTFPKDTLPETIRDIDPELKPTAPIQKTKTETKQKNTLHVVFTNMILDCIDNEAVY